LAPFGDRVVLRQGRYEALTQLVDPGEQFDGVLFDLGVSSLQLDVADRGFSFAHDGPLDMRMDRGTGETAAELVRRLPERELADLIFRWGEERWSRKIARAIASKREVEPITTTTALATIVARTIPRRLWPRHIHPATRTFQAIRIAVNEELVGLAAALVDAAHLLVSGGRAVVISFHSLEDRIVKQTWRRLEATQDFAVLTKRPIVTGEAEIAANPRSRGAKLRAVERVAHGHGAV
jgi:16S rRNA (cytosine1402-N4)-methyltransferase